MYSISLNFQKSSYNSSMKLNLSERAKENIKVYSLSGVIVVLFFFLLRYSSSIFGVFSGLFRALMPFIFGIAITFILLPLRNIIEKKWLKNTNWKDKTKRRVSVFLSIVFLLGVIVLFLVLLIPQLVSSVQTLIGSMDGYLRTLEKFLSGFNQSGQYNGLLENLFTAFESTIRSWTAQLTNFIPKIVNYSVSVVSSIFNFFIGLIVASYFMLDQERFVEQVKRVINILFSEKTKKRLYHVVHLTNRMFNNFIFGKAIDSFIIGIICWVVTSIMRIPYAPLVSFVVGITNMIPVFGPFIGAIPSIFIILFISPLKALEFAIFIIILQQVDGNLLGPYILGDSMGLPAIWIMFAILVGGSLFGIAGMFLGVPVFSVIYYLIREWIVGHSKTYRPIVNKE